MNEYQDEQEPTSLEKPLVRSEYVVPSPKLIHEDIATRDSSSHSSESQKEDKSDTITIQDFINKSD